MAVTRWLKYGFGYRFKYLFKKRASSKWSNLESNILLPQYFCIPVRMKLTKKGTNGDILGLLAMSSRIIWGARHESEDDEVTAYVYLILP